MKSSDRLPKGQQKWMERALDSARTGIRRMDGGPFGAAIVRGDQVIAVTHNTVLKDQDATCHAEVNAIRRASRKLKKFDLSDCVIYSTTEPCPMCFSAIHWACLGEVTFGSSIADVQKRGFNELSSPCKKMKQDGRSRVRIKSGFMKKECLSLLDEWDRQENKKTY